MVENEQKAFDIVKLYATRTKNIVSDDEQNLILHNLDNEIQAKEIEAHLQLNSIPQERRTVEQIDWVSRYGHSFRMYLNTLKIIFLAIQSSCFKDPTSMSFEDFCAIKDRINSRKAFLDIIHS